MRAPVEDHAAGQRAVGHLALDGGLARDEPHRRRCAGSWLACTAARTSAGEAPDTPIGSGPVEALPAKAKPRMAAMASGATRQVITAERSRTRRRSSLRVMRCGQPPRS